MCLLERLSGDHIRTGSETHVSPEPAASTARRTWNGPQGTLHVPPGRAFHCPKFTVMEPTCLEVQVMIPSSFSRWCHCHTVILKNLLILEASTRRPLRSHNTAVLEDGAARTHPPLVALGTVNHGKSCSAVAGSGTRAFRSRCSWGRAHSAGTLNLRPVGRTLLGSQRRCRHQQWNVCLCGSCFCSSGL